MATNVVLDLRGVRCPLPIVRLNNRIKTMGPGEPLAFVADDPAFLLDVRVWAHRLGYELRLDANDGPQIWGSVCRPV